MLVNLQLGDLKFSERVYLSNRKIYNGFGGTRCLVAFSDVDEAVPICDEIEVGIYQLVRVAKFKKTSVEVKTLKEIPAGQPSPTS
jgi:hypothetical protein